MLTTSLLLATVFFPRAQLHYGLERDDYLHRWYDRPLFQDTSFKAAAEPGHFINRLGWTETVRALRQGQCGIGTFIDQSRRDDLIARAALPGHETTFLAEYDSVHSGEDFVAHVLRTAEKAIASPHAFRLDGRVVLTEYGARTVKDEDLENYVKVRAALAAKFGQDKFYVLPYLSIAPGVVDLGRPVEPSVLKAAEERLRKVLLKTDGFVWDGRESIRARRFVGKTRDEVWTPLVRRILDEPAFKDRKLGVLIRAGHMNTYLCGYTTDAAGTQTLRENLESATRAGADLVIGAEWDEENENTSLAPMVYTGHSTQRILSYYADRWAGRKPSLFPGDAPDVPNLIVSYRKSVIAGEPLELEVANVPDGTFAGQTFEIVAEWRNARGEAVERFKAKSLPADTCGAVWFTVPSSKLVANRTLRPVIGVRVSEKMLGLIPRKRTLAFSDGFWPVDLNATRTVDFQWVKQPLREILTDVEAEMAAVRQADGRVRVKASVRSEKPLRFVEILEGTDTLRMAGDDAPGEDRVTIRIGHQGHICSDTPGYRLNGAIRFLNADGLRLAEPYSPKAGITREKDGYRFRDFPGTHWDAVLFADLPKARAAEAVIEYDLAPSFKGCVAVRDILARQIVGTAGQGGRTLTFQRYDKTRFLPVRWDKREAAFDFTFSPGDRNPVLRLQVADADGRLWRGRAVELLAEAGAERTFHVFEQGAETVSAVTLPEGRLDDVSYDLADLARGTVLWGGVRDLSGALGGTVAQVCGYGNGASLYGNLLTRHMKNTLPGWDKSVPQREGDGSVSFANCAFGCLPWSIVPPYAGYELTMEIKPERLGVRQSLLTGKHANHSLVLDANGEVVVAFELGNLIDTGRGMERSARGPAVRPNEWNLIRVTFDQRRAQVEVNGVKGAAVEISGYEYYPSTFLLATDERKQSFFAGRIRQLSIKTK